MRWLGRHTRAMTTASASQSTVRPTVVAAVVGAAVISVANLAIASTSLAIGTPSVVQLEPLPYLSFSVLAGVVGAVGWALVRRRAKNPRRLLGLLAVVGLVGSLVPLAGLAATTVAATGWAPIVTLAIMHVATFGLAVVAFSRLLPVRGR